MELHVGDCSIICLGTNDLPDDRGEPRLAAPTPWVFVDDLDAQYARVTAGGATILTEIWEHGVRAFDAADLEGNRWTFAQASPRMRDERP
jgi:predicted enzyme related to lactoylglutathione lyase